MSSKSRQSPVLLCGASRTCLLFQPLVWRKKNKKGKQSINYPMLELVNIYLLMLHVGRPGHR